jgi:hypothetical protein
MSDEIRRASAPVKAHQGKTTESPPDPKSRLDPFLQQLILPDCRTVLDVGCGEEAALLRRVPGIPRSVGVDMHVPEPGSKPPRHSEYIRMDVRSIGERFEPASFDSVVAIDVIEHLSRGDGLALLEAMEKIAARRVIVFTPNGFLPQPPDPDNAHQEHISGWEVKDFIARGYRVLGMNGWKPLRGDYAEIRWRPYRLWHRLSLMTNGLVESRPGHAFQLLCVKETGESAL